MLDLQQKRYENGEKYLSAFDMNRLLTPLKKQEEYAWLNDISAGTLQHACGDLSNAYNRFFHKISGYPKFKSRKRSKPSFALMEESFYFKETVAIIPKVGKVKYRTDFNIPLGKGKKFSNPRISFVNDKWILSFGMECENQTPRLTENIIGIDLGVKELAVVANGEEKIVFHNINKSKRMRQLLHEKKRLQRSISRKYEQNHVGKKYVKTKNIEHLENRLRNVCSRIANIRNNYVHQTTHTLVSLLPKRVVMEDLNVTGMMKNKHLSRAISEQGFYEFIRQMKYKCKWNGIEFIQVDRFYPSSKTCSSCGCIKKDLKLSDRTYVCNDCGAVIDRDFNAALNLARYAA